VQINPSTSGSTPGVGVENLKPGQKIKVILKEGEKRPAPSKSPTTKPAAPVKVVPKPSGSTADIGITNLKPGQKIKVTVKSGGTKK
jgi:cold shock CspA family protein